MSLLRLSSVAKSYRRGYATVDVLRDVSLTVTARSLVSIYGARGSGKTSLLKIVAGFETPDAGEIVRDHVTRDLAWVQSDGSRMGRISIGTYVALPLYRELGPRTAHDRARRALSTVAVEQYADDCWDDLPNVARALCAITHATIQQPRLLVADDPTAGLGALDRERVCGALRAAADDGLGVLIAVPDLSSTLRSHDTMVLSRGRLLTSTDDRDDAEVVDLESRRSA